jgi:Kef-type K+ transport system membrane component KefB
MSHHDLVLFPLQLAIMLTVAVIVGRCMNELHWPAVVGELIGGIILGPTVLASFAPNLYEWLFPTEGATPVAREAIVKVGMLFFLAFAGAEVSLSYARLQGLTVVWTSSMGIIVPFCLGFILVILSPVLWGPPANNNSLRFALVVATIMAISALPVIAKILIDLDLIKTEVGMIVMTAATLDDLIGWFLFTIILNSLETDALFRPILWSALCLIVLIILSLTAHYWLDKTTVRRLRPLFLGYGNLTAIVAIVVLATAAITEAVGIHSFFGAFLIGIALARPIRELNRLDRRKSRSFTYFLASLYFVSIGLQVDFAKNFDLLLVLLVLFMACVGKIVGVWLGARIGRLPSKEALAVAFGMNARGAMGIILASLSLEHKLIDQRAFVALVIMALVTSIISGPAMKRMLAAKVS